MVATYDEFAAEHRAEHLSPFNRWCVVVGNSTSVLGAVLTLSGRWRAGMALFGSGGAILGLGHLVEGNLPRAAQDLVRHPIWATRADLAVARATILGALHGRVGRQGWPRDAVSVWDRS